MNTAYPLFSISILTILLYSLSFMLVRMGMVSRSSHRKFWNVLLLLTFLGTGLIGLLMVVKINYKLEIPCYEELLSYHVWFGIGMAIIAFFHLWWHLSYYLHLFRTEKSSSPAPSALIKRDVDERFLKVSAFLLGETSIIAQVILLREFLTVFNGNELVVGLVLANWMVLTGLGAWLGKFPIKTRKVLPVVVAGLLILSALPFVTAVLINFLKNLVFPMGALISIFQIFLASLVMLVPFCLVSGFLFTFITNCYSEIRQQNETGRIYGIESVGSIVGGLLSGLLFIFVFSSIESLLALAILNGLVILKLILQKPRRKLVLLPMAVIVPALALLFFHPEKKVRSWVYPNQQIEVSKDSPHGNMVITRRGKLLSVYNNNVLMFDSENLMLSEEAVHFAMLQHPHPARVLLVSGGLSGQIAELKKYRPELVDYVEDNRWLLALMKDSLRKITGQNIRVHAADPIRFIRNCGQTYDVAIMNLPAPSTLQTNRFYTLEFFTILKERLSRGAVFSFGLTAPANYLNREAADLNSTIFATLKKVFRNVIVIPGEKNYFVASDGSLTYHIAQAIQERGIENQYVNPFYFDDVLLKRRSEAILSALNPGAEFNRNLDPVSYRQQLAYWLSQFKGRYWLLAACAGALALFVFFRGNTPSRAMFLTGFSASSLEILLLFGLQVFFGNIYLLTSFVFTGFMLGLAGGAFLGTSVKTSSGKNLLTHIQMLIGLFAAVFGLLLFSSGMSRVAPAVVYSLYLVATVLTGGLTGLQFSTASLVAEGSYSEISGKTYSYDLFGSALGALAVSVYLVPQMGIVFSVLTISVLNLAFGSWLIIGRFWKTDGLN